MNKKELETKILNLLPEIKNHAPSFNIKSINDLSDLDKLLIELFLILSNYNKGNK